MTATGATMMKIFSVSIAVCLCGGLAFTKPAIAQQWPTRPLTMVVPFVAGSSSDSLARTLAPRLSEALKQQVIIENVPGKGGMIGGSRVAKGAPDGYEFVLGTVTSHAQSQSLYKTPLYDAATAFTPVALVADQPQILVIRSEISASNLPEFIDFTRANQSKMRYGSAGVGTSVHLVCALFNVAIGVNITHVPSSAGGPAMPDLLAGRIDYQCPAATNAIRQVQADQVKAVAMLTHDRSPLLPGLRSAHEQGLTGFDASIWNGIFLPKGTPVQIVQKLHGAAVMALEAPSMRERMKELGIDAVAPERRSPEYLQRFVESEIQKWVVPIRAANISEE